MDRQEVVAECKRLNREHPRRREVSWVPRELSPGDWVVARIPRQRSGAGRPDPARGSRAR